MVLFPEAIGPTMTTSVGTGSVCLSLLVVVDAVEELGEDVGAVVVGSAITAGWQREPVAKVPVGSHPYNRR